MTGDQLVIGQFGFGFGSWIVSLVQWHLWQAGASFLGDLRTINCGVPFCFPVKPQIRVPSKTDTPKWSVSCRYLPQAFMTNQLPARALDMSFSKEMLVGNDPHLIFEMSHCRLPGLLRSVPDPC